MEYEWDDGKRQINMAKHGVDLLEAVQIFTGETVSAEDSRTDYGEQRLVTIGQVAGQFYVLVHTERDGVIRLISARKGGRRDRRKYQTGFAQRNTGDEG